MRIQQQSPFATDKSRCLASAFWLALLPAQYWCLSIRHAASSPLLLSMAPLHSLNANVYVVKSASGREPIQALRAVPCRGEEGRPRAAHAAVAAVGEGFDAAMEPELIRMRQEYFFKDL